MYQSFGWLNAFSFKENWDKQPQSVGYYLNLSSLSTPNKGAYYEALYRPVYSPRRNPGITYRQVEPEVFISIRDKVKRLPFLTDYDANELRLSGSKAFLSNDYATGYVLSGAGDLQNVFNIGPRGQGKTAVMDAIARGAKTVDAFDPFLPKYYEQFGFKEYGRAKWDDQYAPKNWPYNIYGRPDVVFMKLESASLPNPHIGVEKYNGWRHGNETKSAFDDFDWDEY